MARQGKIARLPHKLRKQVNTRLRDGESAPRILAWLNQEPAAIAVWKNEFKGVPCSEQNLSEWRTGGFQDFLRERERLDAITSLSDYALELAQRSGASLADGAAAIIAGKIVTGFEQMVDEEEEGGMKLADAAAAVAMLRAGNLGKEKHQLAKDKHQLAQKKAELDREKFEKQTVTMFLRFARTPEAQTILNSSEPKHVQMDLLHDLLFPKPSKK